MCCVCVCRLLSAQIGGRMSFSAVHLLSWFEGGGSDSSTHQCRCSLTSSRQILDLSLCPVTLEFPRPLYILTDFQGFEESRFPPNHPKHHPPAQHHLHHWQLSMENSESLIGWQHFTVRCTKMWVVTEEWNRNDLIVNESLMNNSLISVISGLYARNELLQNRLRDSTLTTH